MKDIFYMLFWVTFVCVFLLKDISHVRMYRSVVSQLYNSIVWLSYDHKGNQLQPVDIYINLYPTPPHTPFLWLLK